MHYQKGGRLSKDGRENKVKSIQQNYTDEEIQEKMRNYVQVEDIDSVAINTHVRYFRKNGKDYEFRTGGFLKKKENPKYVVLSNSPKDDGQTWTVQRNTAIFYRIKTKTEQILEENEIENEALVSKYQSTLQKQQQEIKKLREALKKANQ